MSKQSTEAMIDRLRALEEGKLLPALRRVYAVDHQSLTSTDLLEAFAVEHRISDAPKELIFLRACKKHKIYIKNDLYRHLLATLEVENPIDYLRRHYPVANDGFNAQLSNRYSNQIFSLPALSGDSLNHLLDACELHQSSLAAFLADTSPQLIVALRVNYLTAFINEQGSSHLGNPIITRTKFKNDEEIQFLTDSPVAFLLLKASKKSTIYVDPLHPFNGLENYLLNCNISSNAQVLSWNHSINEWLPHIEQPAELFDFTQPYVPENYLTELRRFLR
ncbi:hypothetical protein ACPV5O_24955 [Vibrio maritimus]|uniref:hypothetical protein n=1 Tax=Vibrio maritimus TaxID=990268 RepID=UPI0040680C53